MNPPHVFSSPNIGRVPLCWWKRVLNSLVKRYDPTRVVAVVGQVAEGICTGLHVEWIRETLEAYRKEKKINCYVFVWGPKSPLDRTCVAAEIETVVLCELSTQTSKTQPAESTIDLLCAIPGKGRGSKALAYVENFIATKAGSKLVKLNATQASWPFYWRCGYKIDHKDCSKMLKKWLKKTHINNFELVHDAIEASDETTVPMVKELAYKK
jgi:hypothetical protein